MRNRRLQMMAEIAVMATFAWILSLYRVGKMPQGGSVSLQMLPIFVSALRWGPGPGMVTGLLLSGIKLMMDPEVVHPIQMLLDYPIAFAAIGLAGFFKDKPLVGITAGGLARWFCHFLAGVVFFGSYAPEGTSAVAYSAVYNITYMLPEIALSVAIAPLILRRLSTSSEQELSWRHNAVELLSLLAPLTAMALVVGLRKSIPAINYAGLVVWIVLAGYHLLQAFQDWRAAKRGLALVSIPPALVYVTYLLLR